MIDVVLGLSESIGEFLYYFFVIFILFFEFKESGFDVLSQLKPIFLLNLRDGMSIFAFEKMIEPL